ncbi:MAG: hypothetical protein KAW61_00175, partial [candidate division Zixibacteria bacterium]|nr:hypothetical protein [candidate division Zixibacteria bacterium]
DTDHASARMQFHRTASALDQTLGHFDITVVYDSDNLDTLAVAELTLNGEVAEGTIDSLPAGEALLFIARAFQSGTDIVIYEGRTVTELVAREINEVEIQMSPVVPLMKFTPCQVEITDTYPFYVDTKVFNIDSLYGISFRVTLDTSFVAIDSIQPAAGLAGDEIIFFWRGDTVSTDTAVFAVAISHTIPGSMLVDSSGDAALARLWLHRKVSSEQTIEMSIRPTGGVLVNSTDLVTEGIYRDNCLLFIAGSLVKQQLRWIDLAPLPSSISLQQKHTSGKCHTFGFKSIQVKTAGDALAAIIGGIP